MAKQTLSLEQARDFDMIIQDACLSGCKIASWLIIIIYGSFYLVDRAVVPPEHHFLFAIMRIVVCSLNAFLLAFIYNRNLFKPQYVALFIALTVGLPITSMVHFTGGHQSPYYAGLGLVMVGISVSIPWEFRYQLILGTIVYLSYVATILLFDNITNVGAAVNNNGFLLGNLLLSLASTKVNYGFRFKNFLAGLEIREANVRLKELDQAKSNFLATISHELKTPMTLIVNPIEQALTQRGEEEIHLKKEQADVVKRNTYRLATMVGDLIEISRGEVGKRQLVPSEVPDVKEHFQELFETMKPLFEEKGIQIEFIAGSGKPHYFDVKKIDKVFTNLLGNALKFTPKGGEVRVRVWDEVETPLGAPQEGRAQQAAPLRIQVTDTGIGIPSDKIGKIFERFMQVEEGATRSYEGMGIGLSLVKDFVEQHGGSVTVKSEVGKGSTFVVTLPRGKDHFKVPAVEIKETFPILEKKLDFTRELIGHQTQEESLLGTEEVNEEKKTILIVDDNRDVQKTIREVLRAEYNVILASNGQEGLEKTGHRRPDLILSDIMMPVMNGYQMTREIRRSERLKDVPILLLTAKTGEEGLAEGFEAGANDYLTKPFSPQELQLRVKNQLLLRDLLESELIRQQNLASVGMLAAGIAHDINNYAASVDAGLYLANTILERERETGWGQKVGEIQKSLQSADAGLQSVRHMIRSLQTYTQKNVQGLRREDIVKTTRAVVELARAKLPPDMTVTFRSPEEIVCTFNPHLLNPALLNLIDNGAEACRGKGQIQVSLANGEKEVLIQIQDNGSGIPCEIQERIWEPYFTTKGDREGTGLGLWMVKRAIETEHKGKITFQTGPAGTTFSISLPKEVKNESTAKKKDSHNR